MSELKPVVSVRRFFQTIYDKALLVGWDESDDKRFKPTKGIKTYAGGASRPQSRKRSKVGQLEVIGYLEQNGRPVFTRSAKNLYSKEFKETFDFYIKSFSLKEDAKTFAKRALNRALSIFKKPMMAGDFKREDAKTIKRKGFSRPSIDTAQSSKKVSSQFQKIKKGG